MGVCCYKQKSLRRVNASTMYYSVDVKYPRTTYITIQKRNSREKIIHTETMELVNTDPIFTISDEYDVGTKILASACVLPGKDPRGNFNKICRDFCFLTCEDGNLIGGLFDGHGKEGEKIVSFCISETDYFFTNEISRCRGDFNKFLKDLIGFLEDRLEKNSEIDISNSGASCVIFLLSGKELNTANLGCCRLILASSNTGTDIYRRRFSFTNRFQFLSEISDVRRKILKESVSTMQMTHDHKPNDIVEIERLASQGGVVKKLTDAHGNQIGPYRVSQDFKRDKGLTISRTLGSTNMRNIGVISDPHLERSFMDSSDKFFIAASDGVWRVMTNKDAADFVECHRKLCLTNVERPTFAEVVLPENACIAQLLCEEARLRWLAIVENEDSVIDDISCIIIEFVNEENHETSGFNLNLVNDLENKENDGQFSLFTRRAGISTLKENYNR